MEMVQQVAQDHQNGRAQECPGFFVRDALGMRRDHQNEATTLLQQAGKMGPSSRRSSSSR